MKRVLIVAYYFPPTAASGSLRPLAFSRHLEAFGWIPRVLSTDAASVYPPLESDTGLLEKVPHALQIDRVPHRNMLQAAIQLRDRLLQRSASAQDETSFPPAAGPTRLMGGLTQRKDLLLDHVFEFPDPQASWLRPAVRHAVRTLSRNPIDAVFATGKPWTGLLVGFEIARRFGIPLIADFRDPWTHNRYSDRQAPSLAARACKLERQVCLEAACVVANTDELRQQFQQDYPDLRTKFVTITNGFDDWMGDDAPVAASTVSSGGRLEGGAVNLWHFGMVYGQRDPVALLRAVKELDDEGAVGAGKLRLRFVGGWSVTNPESNSMARELEERGLLAREPQIAHDECMRQMRLAPVLLAIQPSSPLQIPAKLYEYLAVGRPLLIVGGEGATAALVERHRLARCCPNRVTDLKQLLRELLEHPNLRVPDPSGRAPFHYRELTRNLAARLDEAVVDQRDRVCA